MWQESGYRGAGLSGLRRRERSRGTTQRGGAGPVTGMTLQDLLGFDAGPWHSAADAWHRLAQGVDDASDELISGTRDLSEAWSRGTGTAAAAEKVASLRGEVTNTYLP